MGIKCSPDIAQEAIKPTLRNIEDVEVFVDDIEIFSDNWKQHLTLLEKVLDRLEDNGFAITPLKCEWAV
jgi:hypothetical protein